MAKLTHFEELEAWKACLEVVRWVREIVKENFPKHYDLKDNMSRAARSTTRNIAEGFGRHHHGENRIFNLCEFHAAHFTKLGMMPFQPKRTAI